MSIKEFRLPDVGEGLTEADIVSWKVKPGDVLKVNDTIVEIETAKSLVELPSPFAGVVSGLLVDEGSTVEVGTPIIAVETEPGTGPAPTPVPAAVPAQPDPGLASDLIPAPVLAASQAPDDVRHEPAKTERGATRMAVLVGYGVKTASLTRRPRKVPSPATMRAPGAGGPGTRPLAKPPVRKLAKERGVDLASLTPTGPGGVITRADVEHAHSRDHESFHSDHEAFSDDHETVQRDHEKLPARETRIPVKGVRKATAQAMVASAFTAPHVTEWVQVDVTRTVKLVERLKQDPAFDGVRVGPLLLVAKALLVAVRRNPGVNASWDEPAGEIVVHHGVNLGIAAATPRGLVVPNVKDADRLTLRGLADALAALTSTAREGRTPPADLAGGTITITNVGVFGVDAGTPILNPGEAMILAVGQVRQLPWVHKGKVVPRWVTTLAVSFDHRLVDGDLGSRFLADVAGVLEDPRRVLTWG